MLKIGLTGNIAAGKTVFENFLRDRGFSVLDADDFSHEVVMREDVKTQIVNEFAGKDILEDGEISRSKLGKVVFPDETYRKKLEGIIHPLLKTEIGRFFRSCQEQGEKIAVVSAALLFEAKFEGCFDKIVLIYADDGLRIERLMKRNDLTLEQAQQRLDIQMSQDEKILKSDYVIYNNNKIDNFEKNAQELLELF